MLYVHTYNINEIKKPTYFLADIDFLVIKRIISACRVGRALVKVLRRVHATVYQSTEKVGEIPNILIAKLTRMEQAKSY